MQQRRSAPIDWADEAPAAGMARNPDTPEVPPGAPSDDLSDTEIGPIGHPQRHADDDSLALALEPDGPGASGRQVVPMQAEALLNECDRLMRALGASATESLPSGGTPERMTGTVGCDPLTSLPNRRWLLDRLWCALATARRNGSKLSVLFLDINGFRQINLARGYAAGDDVLRRSAKCLRAAVRNADSVCRWEDDEFVVLLNHVEQSSDATMVAKKLAEGIGRLTDAQGRALRLTVSIGITVFPDDGEDAMVLLGRANSAWSRAKMRSRGVPMFP